MSEYRAQFPSAYESVGRARRAIASFAREWFSGQSLDDIETAVGEALANCAEHGHRSGMNIDVRCRCDGEQIAIEIKDGGAGFDRSNDAGHRVPRSDAPRGFGMFIMRELMDAVEYSDSGSRLRLIKRLPAQSADPARAGAPTG